MKRDSGGIIHLLEALNTAAAADNVILQAILQYGNRAQLRADIEALTAVISELNQLKKS